MTYVDVKRSFSQSVSTTLLASQREAHLKKNLPPLINESSLLNASHSASGVRGGYCNFD